MKLMLLSFCLTLVSACSTYYYGYSKEQWQSLSPQVQAEIIAEYERIVEEKNGLVQGDSREQAGRAFVERALEKTQGGYRYNNRSRL